MKHRKRSELRVEVRETVREWETCDICGEEIDKEPDNFEVYQFEMRCQTGNVWPEYDASETTRFDCCQSCWPKVCAALREIGATLHTHSTEDGPAVKEEYE